MIPDQVALCALEHYNKTIVKGKPKASEWTVYAAIVVEEEAEKDSDNLWVVSSATGTKCTALRKQGHVLHDGHAEVLARRGLVRVLWTELLSRETKQETDETLVSARKDKSLLEVDGDSKYRLRSNLRLHLYISDSPCGDAAIYPIHNEKGAEEVLYTGAKIVVTESTGVDATACGGDHQLLDGAAPIAREDTQVLGRLRTKSGRSNLAAHQRCTSMSCSDKIVRWCVLGLQGGLLSSYISKPIHMSSVIVSEDPRLVKNPNLHNQLQALERAVTDRVKDVWESVHSQTDEKRSLRQDNATIPASHIVTHQFSSGKAAMAGLKSKSNRDGNNHDSTTTAKKRKRDDSSTSSSTVSPCGFALNWQCSSSIELVVGVRGIRQGKKPKSDQDYQKLASRLSRSAWVEFYKEMERRDNIEERSRTYQDLKERVCYPERSQLKTWILTGGPLVGWLKDSTQSDFALERDKRVGTR
jgi:hypothetical protein